MTLGEDVVTCTGLGSSGNVLTTAPARSRGRFVAPLCIVAIVVGAWLLLCQGAIAQQRGVNVQVNEGGQIPTVEQIEALVKPGGFVRDTIGWGHVDPKCDLVSKPKLSITLTPELAKLYANVAAAQAQNFITLGFNNTHCGQHSSSGATDFPDTDKLRREFAAYAVSAVKTVPALGGISIWDEMNGTFGGGLGAPANRLAQYCLLSNAVIQAVRSVNPTVPIAIGATVGVDISAWFIDMFDIYGCIGKNDPTIWLDVHPYLSGKKNDFGQWRDTVADIRADGINNQLIATEWGDGAAYAWTIAHPNHDYITTFDQQVQTGAGDWAGLIWFDLLTGTKFSNSGLIDPTGDQLTVLGKEYVSDFDR